MCIEDIFKLSDAGQVPKPNLNPTGQVKYTSSTSQRVLQWLGFSEAQVRLEWGLRSGD